jgi:uncharacterized lipoprotein YajG
MSTFKALLTFAACALLAGCGSMPTTATTRVDNPPTVAIANAPEGAAVSIDGTYVGATTKKDNSFVTSPGRHSVSVEVGGVKVLTENIFVQDGTTRVLSIK